MLIECNGRKICPNFLCYHISLNLKTLTVRCVIYLPLRNFKCCQLNYAMPELQEEPQFYKGWNVYLSISKYSINETGWDLGPFAAALQCLHLDTPLLEQQNIEKLYGTKNNCVHGQLEQILDPKDTKRPKRPNCHFWGAWSKNRVSGVKAGYCICPLHTTPPKGWGKHLSHPSGPTPGHIPTLTPYKKEVPLGKQRSLLFVLAPARCSRGPNKALTEFPGWPLVNFYWLGKAKNPGW